MIVGISLKNRTIIWAHVVTALAKRLKGQGFESCPTGENKCEINDIESRQKKFEKKTVFKFSQDENRNFVAILTLGRRLRWYYKFRQDEARNFVAISGHWHLESIKMFLLDQSLTRKRLKLFGNIRVEWKTKTKDFFRELTVVSFSTRMKNSDEWRTGALAAHSCGRRKFVRHHNPIMDSEMKSTWLQLTAIQSILPPFLLAFL